MAQEPLNPLRLRELFNAVCDEGATREQLDELQRILQTDELARQSYLNQCRMHVDLYFAAREQKMLAQAVDSLDASALEASALEAGAMIESTPIPGGLPAVPGASSPTKSPVLGFLGGVIDYVNHSQTMFWLVALTAATLSCVLIFLLASVVVKDARERDAQLAVQHSGRRIPDVSHPPGGPFANPAPPRQSDSVASTTAAFVTAMVDCHWRVVSSAAPPASAPAPGDVDTALDTGLDNAEPFHVGSELSAGQQFDLVRGLAEITFRSGARIVLDGPARFMVGSPVGGTLQIGKLTARVPHDVHGFAIDSPAGKVVDLGTEFGMAVAADRTMDVEVFVGEVAVSSCADDQTPDSSEKVVAGHAVRVAAGQPIVSIPSDPKQFVRDIGPSEESRVAQTAYLDFMRSLKPVVWFRMEGKDSDRVLHDEMGGASDGKLHWEGAGNPFVEGRIGKGLSLRASHGDYAFIPTYPQAEHGQLTVSAWAYADSRPDWAKIVANWGANSTRQFCFGLYSGGADISVQLLQSNGKYFNLREGDTHPFPLHEWQHVAFVADGSMMRLYRQGREVAAMKHLGILYPVDLKSLAIGAYQGHGEEVHKPLPGYWDGRLDEIAIFNEALSADDIRKLAAAPP